MNHEARPGRREATGYEFVEDLTDDGDAHDRHPADPAARSARLGRRGLAAAATLLTLAAGGLGWFGPELAGALPDQSEPMVTVVVTGRTFDSETRGVRHLAMTAEVANLGAGPVQLLGLATTVSALTTTADFTPGQTVSPRSVTRITMTVRLECSTPAPLRLPALLLRDGAGTTIRRAVTGSSQQLITECQAEYLNSEPTGLQASDVLVSGDQLVVSLTTVGRRPIRLLTGSAGGLPLATTPTPVMLSPTPRQVRLDPANACSPDWAVSGPRGQLDLTVDWGPDLPDSEDGDSDPFRLRVETGTVGVDWLMRHACREWSR
jgi:hypothetical protein